MKKLFMWIRFQFRPPQPGPLARLVRAHARIRNPWTLANIWVDHYLRVWPRDLDPSLKPDWWEYDRWRDDGLWTGVVLDVLLSDIEERLPLELLREAWNNASTAPGDFPLSADLQEECK